MSIFAWLVIGHFVGDWMFQNDWMARNKRGRWWAAECIVHCLVYTVAVVLAAHLGSGGALPLPLLGMIFVTVLVSHWLIDGLNLAELWGRVVNQTETDYVRIVVDQTMHLLVLGIVTSLFLS